MKKHFSSKPRSGGEFHHKHSLGQNFIEDETLLEELAGLSLAGENDCVLEIGPGFGALTKPLAARSLRTLSLEIDSTLLPILRVALEHSPNAEVVLGDVMKTDLAGLVSEHFGTECSLRVAANLPYYITSDVLQKLMKELPQAKSIAVMIQKEVAEKLLTGPGDDGYGPLTLMLNLYYDIEIAKHVPAACFTPPPKVDSAFVVMERREAPRYPLDDEDAFMRLVKAAFAMRRKTLPNNLMGFFRKDREGTIALLESCGIGEKQRAEELTLEQFCRLSNAAVKNC